VAVVWFGVLVAVSAGRVGWAAPAAAFASTTGPLSPGVLVAVVSVAGGVWPEAADCDDKVCDEGGSVDKVPVAASADGVGLRTGADRSGFRAGRGIVSVLASAQAGTAQAKAMRSAILYACVRFMIVGCFRLRPAFSA
ncbi:MAG TPA: hypothetical protein DDW48_08865, partial [Methyloceanibacter sp.]|nr:hypothetical protein [Methyloceanibacter sp.]